MKKDIHQEITNSIIEQLEIGVVPWVKPWKDAKGASSGMPHNAVTGRLYRGVNVLILWGSAWEKGYRSQGWLTYKQAEYLGGHVRKGEKSTFIIFNSPIIPKGEKKKAQDNPSYEPITIFYAKMYSVFNYEQCENLPVNSANEGKSPENIHQEAESIIANTGANISYGSNQACYYPTADRLEMPSRQQFPDILDFYRVAFHELAHWTGHPSRLNRDISQERSQYAFEELVAEISAAFTSAHSGIAPTLKHADYIGYWLEKLREDKKAIFKASSLAAKATDYIVEGGHSAVKQAA